jgi:alpha-amylase
MPQVCIYLQLHQPWRLGNYSIFDLGSQASYFTDESEHNKKIFQKVAAKSYLPMLTLLLQLIKSEPQFCFALSLSGVFVEQAQAFEPRVITLIQELVKSKRVELLAETYYHSLSALYSKSEFEVQVWRQMQLMQNLFGYTPRVFRNTELIYSNAIAERVAQLGFTGMLTEAVDRYLQNRPKTRVYYSHPDKNSTLSGNTAATLQKPRIAQEYTPLPLLLKHAQLSDDVAFRFSDRNWDWYPLTVERYLDWVEVYEESEIINLFMDFETFGEHQWADTGIFEFWAAFVHRFTQKSWNKFVTPTQVFVGAELERKYANKWSKKAAPIPDTLRYDVPEPISWADVDRDLTAWRGNQLQWDTLEKIYEIQDTLYARKDEKMLDTWRRLQTSDHFYYMCTKWSADGDVHAYFSPYNSPYEAYRRYSVVLADLMGEIK